MIDLDGLSGDDDLQRPWIGERERHVAGTDLDPQKLASPAKSEGQPGEGGGQLRVEVELLGDEAQPPKPSPRAIQVPASEAMWSPSRVFW